MEAPISPGRRTLLKAGALTLATPVIGAVAQPAASHQEATTFDLWVIRDSHVGTDKAVSAWAAPERGSSTRHRSDCGMHLQWRCLGSRIEYRMA